MIDDDIRALREALAGGPTPGPWESFPVGHGSQRVARVNNREVVPPDACELAHEIVDARYIAAASPDRIARLLAEVERLRKENHDLNWALGTDGYATLSDPEDQAASDAAHAAAFANLDRLKARKTRHETLLPDGRDALDEIERLREALTAANAQAEHFEREWYLRGDEIERLRADVSVAAREAQTLRNQRDELRIILDKRPAMNEGLREAYAKWSAGVYALDWMDAADIDAARNGDWK